ncbi:MAG TPA: FG-GAP-like repeat-containing protein [Kofleriaceae bacterium]|nr:FG-GAP-like repeat-containing protein [Kofleriaceae bacterium]
MLPASTSCQKTTTSEPAPSAATTPAPQPAPSAAPAGAPAPQPAPTTQAEVVREELSPAGETRLFSAGVADLDRDGALELVAGGFSAVSGGRRSTVLVYRQRGAEWTPLAEGGWDGGPGSTIRNVQVADVDGDGRQDVVALGRIGATPWEAKARVAVLALSGQTLEVRAQEEWLTGTYTHGFGLAVGDLDGDGRAEIVTGGFQGDAAREVGFVRVWSLAGGKLALRAEHVLDGQGATGMRVNDLAIGDVDGDGRPEIVAAGRRGPRKQKDVKLRLDQRRETGDVSVLAYADGKLAVRARHAWAKGTSLRLRALALADTDGDGAREIVVGGQYDADGKPCLGLFALAHGKLVQRDDASATTAGMAGMAGEVKDLLAVGTGAALRVLVTGAAGTKEESLGDLAAWRIERGRLVRDADLMSRNGDTTRARAVVVVPDGTVLTIGHAKDRATMMGQVLRWKLEVPQPAEGRKG